MSPNWLRELGTSYSLARYHSKAELSIRRIVMSSKLQT